MKSETEIEALHRKLMTEAYEHEMCQSPDISKEDLDGLVDMLMAIGLADTKDEVVIPAFYMWFAGGARGGLPNTNSVAAKLTQIAMG